MLNAGPVSPRRLVAGAAGVALLATAALATTASGTRAAAAVKERVGDTIGVRDASPPPGTPCLRGDAAELVEALSVRGPLPTGAPAEWHAHLRSLATVFDTDPP